MMACFIPTRFALSVTFNGLGGSLKPLKSMPPALGASGRFRFWCEPSVTAEQWSGLRHYTRPNLLQGHRDHSSPLHVHHTVKLLDIVRECQMPQLVDYLSLDLEGAEYPVLKAYFGGPAPTFFRCMTIEVGLHADHIKELCALLEPLGYRLDNIRAWDAYFYHPSLV
jgi:hypothetical protein